MAKFIYLVPLFPLIGFLINGLGRNFLSKKLSGIIGSLAILASFVVSVLVFLEVKAIGFTTVEIKLFDFIKTAGLDIPFSFQVDQLSVLFLLIITGVGTLIHLYSTAYMHEEEPKDFARYFAYLNLFVFSMLLLVLGANYVIMFIGWEGVGLCSYLLIGFWFKNGDYNNAAKKAFVMNRIGDLGFLLAVFWIIGQFGSTSFSVIFPVASKTAPAILTGITLLMFIGAMGKSAQIPLYTWLPDAMAGPTPVSALIHAATMVTAGIYMIARSNILYTLSPNTQQVVAVIGLATSILAATIALQQNDIKKVLAYSTVSQLGLMFLGLGVGAYVGAVFHVMTHAFFKALLFLGAGSVIHAMHHEQDMRNMGGLKKYLPITHITFLIGCIAIAGIPPFSGFFSKDEILMAVYSHNKLFYFLATGSALLTAFYMFRMYALTFHGSFRGTHDQEHHLHESPLAMTIPLGVLAVLAIVAGFIGIPELFAKESHWLEQYLHPIFAASLAKQVGHETPASTEWLLMGTTVVLILGIVFFAVSKFKKYKATDIEISGLPKILENKWYVDELYDFLINRPVRAIANFFSSIFEKYVIDGAVNGVGKMVQYSSRQLRWLQSGQVGSYILIMVVATIVFFIIQIIGK
ncbi:MAG: NADH-quinone oxidoreductase subunit L [Chitinophagaceae bacterium]|nr:NADH-quinone oxidoreductase subunit L [Chitinophagaceae bacterium]